MDTLKLPIAGVSKCSGVTTHGFWQKLQGPQVARHPHSAAVANFDIGALQQASWQCAQSISYLASGVLLKVTLAGVLPYVVCWVTLEKCTSG